MYPLRDGKSRAADAGRVGSTETDPAPIPAQEIPAEAIGRCLGLFSLSHLHEHRAWSHFVENCPENDNAGSGANKQESVTDWKEGRACPGGATQVLPSPTSSFRHSYCTTHSHQEVTGLI